MRNRIRFGGLILIGSLICPWALAQTITELKFSSRFDQFHLTHSRGKFLMAGRSVNLGAFDQFLILFSSEIAGSCGKIGPADLTVKGKLGNKWIERRFYTKAKMVGDGKQCVTVNGDGIYFAPLHRSWFEEDARGKIPLAKYVKITRGDETLAIFEQVKGEWRNGLPDEFPNWDFFKDFTEALAEFPITHRVHEAAAEKPVFTVRTDGKKYDFFKLGGTLWVVALPGTAWLVGSSRWTNWLDMEKSQWVDRSAPQLSFIADKGKALNERRGTLASLDGQWSPSIRDLLTRILLDKTEAPELQREAVRLMRSKPSMDNFGTMVKALGQSKDPELQSAISQALRIRNPKGPVIHTDLDDAARATAIDEWQKWWNSVKDFKHDI